MKDKKKETKSKGKSASTDDVAELELATNSIVKLEEEVIESKDKFTRLFAEFDNYKKRNARERLELITTANFDVMQSIVPVLDDFDRALKAASENEKEGLNLIHSKLLSILTSKGLNTLETQIGDELDVDLHEAITTISAPNDDAKGKVVDIIEKGYKLGDKVIRFAKVVIGE
jgi:molecular chaperone GrpE